MAAPYLQQLTSPYGQSFLVPSGIYGDAPTDPSLPPSIPAPVPSIPGLTSGDAEPDPNSTDPSERARWVLSQINRSSSPAPMSTQAPERPGIPVGNPQPAMQQRSKVRRQQDAAVAARAADPFAQADDANAQALVDQDAANQGLADTQSQIADEQYDARATAMADADKLDAERQQVAKQREQMRTQKEAQITAYTKDVDDTKIDENAFWHDAGTAKDVGRVIAMAMTGLGMALQNRGHEENPVIAMFDAQARKSVQLQMDARDQKEKRLGRAQQGLDAFDRISDSKDARYHADMARRYERGMQMGDLAAAKYGSKLVQDNWKVSRGLLEEKQAKYLADAADKGFQRDVQKANIENARKQTAIAGGHLALAKKQDADSVLRDKRDFDENGRRYNQGFEYQQQKDADELTVKAAALHANGNAKGGDNYQKYAVPGVQQADGSDFLAVGTPEEVGKLRDKKAAATTIVGLLDKALEIRTGWTSDAAKSGEWRRLQQLWGTAKAKGKDALGLGALSGDDYKILDAYLGTSDPTEFRDPSSGILQARETILDDLNDSLRSHGLDAKTRYDIPRIADNGPATPNQLDSAQRELEDPPGRILIGVTDASPDIPKDAKRGVWVDPRDPTTNSSKYYDDGIDGPDQQIIQTLINSTRSTDPMVRDKALSILRHVGEHAPNEGVRNTAHNAYVVFSSVHFPSL